jgi:cytochrome c peroxidase
MFRNFEIRGRHMACVGSGVLTERSVSCFAFPGLEEQVAAVLLNPHEMRSSADELRALLDATPEYRTKLQAAYGVAEPGVREIAGAIASFERTLIGGRSRFDAFLRGRNEALGDEALAGLNLFRTDARCLNCHHGPALTDGEFHNLGLSYYGRSLEDRGRFEITKLNADVGRFRTPTLRNVSRTAPYMHNGIFPLAGVLNLYNAGMPTLVPKPAQAEDSLFPREKSRHLRPLGLNRQDLADLLAFLEALEEPRRRVRPPALPGLHAADE